MPSTDMICNYDIHQFMQICYFEIVLAPQKLYQFPCSKWVQAEVDREVTQVRLEEMFTWNRHDYVTLSVILKHSLCI